MAVLKRAEKQGVLISDLKIATRFIDRGWGLLGHSELPENQALWIHQCQSIHTFFMKFAIDCVFLTSDLKIKALYRDVQPWKMIWPVWGASSVIEMKSGSIDRLGLALGEVLHVGT